MIKYYLIPATFVLERGNLVRTAKYLETLKLNWAGVYVESKDVYVVTVNTIDQTKLNNLNANIDIIELINNTAVKTAVKNKLNIPTIDNNTDVVEAIGKLQEPNFTKNKIWVDTD